MSATTPRGPAAIRTGPHGPSTTASTIRRSSAGSTPKWLHAPGRSGRLREPCRAPTSASTRRRSSGGPAGRLGPRGSDGARATNHGASGTGGAEGPRTPTGAAAFVIPWTSDPAAPRGGIEDAAPDLRPGSPRRRRSRPPPPRRGGRRPRSSGRRPPGGRPPAIRADVVVDASVAGAVAANVADALAGGNRAFVLATTGWDADVARVRALLLDAGAAAVVAPEPVARRRAVPAARGDRGRLVRPGRRLRALDRRVAPARQGGPAVGDRAGAGPPDRGGRPALGRPGAGGRHGRRPRP